LLKARPFITPELVDPTLARLPSAQAQPVLGPQPFAGRANEDAGAMQFVFADENGFIVQEITPVSEPATGISAALAVGLIGWSGRRRLISLWKSSTKWRRQNRVALSCVIHMDSALP
jgi:hypothetical protein